MSGTSSPPELLQALRGVGAAVLRVPAHGGVEEVPPPGQLQGGLQIRHRHQPGTKRPCLLLQQIETVSSRQSGDPDALLPADVQRLPPDGAGGTQKRGRLYHMFSLPVKIS